MGVPYPQFAVEDLQWHVWIWPAAMALGMAIGQKEWFFGMGRLPYPMRVLLGFPLYAFIWVPARIMGWAYMRGAEAAGYADPGLWEIGALVITVVLALAAILFISRLLKAGASERGAWI